MSSEYELRLLDSRGKPITKSLTAFMSLEYARTVNDVGAMTLIVPGQYPLWWFGRDYRIEIWRSVDMRPAYLEGETQWLIRKINIDRDGGERVFKITAMDLNTILKRRIVAYNAASAYATKGDYADDMMKEIVSENFGIGCIDADRDISAWLDIQRDWGLGFPIEKAFSRREVLAVLQEIAQESYENGIYLAFDMIRKSRSVVGFRTYINQRGVDHTKGSLVPILFGENYGNFTNDAYEDDGTEEATFVYAGGQGEEASRVIEDAHDDNRINISPFGRIERFVDARQAKLATTVEDEAEAELRARRPKKTVSGTIANTDKCLYGVHYRFGDRVTVETPDVTMNAFINKIHVTVSAGAEKIDNKLEAVW